MLARRDETRVSWELDYMTKDEVRFICRVAKDNDGGQYGGMFREWIDMRVNFRKEPNGYGVLKKS
jgi:hypothetical protein